MSEQRTYWFPAKRHGWGWGPPVAWQGWVVLAIFFALVAAGALWLLPSRGQFVFLGYVALLCLLLVAVCWVRGERPRWRGRER